MKLRRDEILTGAKDGLPIALGYFAVSFSFGILAIKGDLDIFQATVTSLTNVTSAGQFAGLQIMIASGTILEMVLTQLIINLRYALMSLALSQKLDPDMSLWKKMIIAFANTDEIFAVAIGHQKSLSLQYMLGLQVLPVLGWTLGTLCGAIAGNILPGILVTSLSVALYGMFVAIVTPVAKTSKKVLWIVILAILLSVCINTIPFLSKMISAGMSIVLCTVIASVIGAIVFPVDKEEQS